MAIKKTTSIKPGQHIYVSDERAQHTIIAALRHWQSSSHGAELDEIASDAGAVVPLSCEEVDALVENLNVQFG